MLMRKNFLITAHNFIICLCFMFVLSIVSIKNVYGLCKGNFINLIAETGWINLFPLKIGGVKVFDTGIPDTDDTISNPVCICSNSGKIVVGVTVSFWEPYRLVDSVVDPGCFPSLGINLSDSLSVGRGGVKQVGSKSTGSHFFAHAHFIYASILEILDILTDVNCIDKGYMDLDIAYMTELDPTWNDDLLALVLNPEVILFANPVTGMACMADAMKSTFDLPIDKLFWCMGSWDSAYPLTGATGQDTIIDGASAVAGRMIYKMARQSLMLDRALDACAAVITPIWIKSHYRLQPVRPKAMTGGSVRIGQNTDTWGFFIYDPLLPGHDNWSFLLWRKIVCCMGWSPN